MYRKNETQHQKNKTKQNNKITLRISRDKPSNEEKTK